MRAHIEYLDLGAPNATFDIPAGAEVLDVDWKTDGGLHHDLHICGLWLLIREEYDL